MVFGDFGPEGFSVLNLLSFPHEFHGLRVQFALAEVEQNV